MKSDQSVDEIISSFRFDSDHDITTLVSNLLVQGSTNNCSWILVSFTKSDQNPLAQIPAYSVRTVQDEELLQRGPFAFSEQPPDRPIHLLPTRLRSLAGQRLARLFPKGAFYIPVPSMTSSSYPTIGAGALVISASEKPSIDQKATLIAQLASSISLSRRDQGEVERRMDEDVLAALSRNIEDCNSRREACTAILDSVNRLLPYQAGVLYLVDVNPGMNQYLIYGASRNENPRALYRSFYPREDLGFTWEAAMKQRPIAGSYRDVPQGAKRINDRALKHLKEVHEAWALLPFTSNGRTVGIAHLEGMNFGTGSSGADLELMRRLVARIGTLLHRRLRQEEREVNLHASSQLIEKLFHIIRADGKDRHKGFENLVRGLFSSLKGVQELPSIPISKKLPQMDGLFLLRDSAGTLVTEVKAPLRSEPAVGVQALRQLTHQMDAIGGRLGILVTIGTFSSRTKRTMSRHPILILDKSRVERMCVLSSEDRKQNLLRWFSQAKPGVEFADVS